MASYDTGYEDERFQHPVGHTLHCSICMNVLKDPVMCGQNEHLFCRACITPHLMNFQTCPTCMEPLTVDTLTQASRGIRNLLAELKIRCEFFNRGCGKFIELGDLERHVTDCGFAPVVCSNEGCRLEVNKRDLLHHETAVCELRRVQCHNCNEIRQEIDTVKVSLVAMDEKLDRNEKEVAANMKTVEENVIAKVELVQEQFNKQEESNRQLKADNEEMKKSLNEMTRLLENMAQALPEVQAEQMRKGIAESDGMDREPKLIIAGGINETGRLNTVEMFSVSNGTWATLQHLRKARQGASSVVYDNKVFVIGGYVSTCGTKSMEMLSVNAVHGNQSIAWKNVPVVLPGKFHAHCSVIYNGRLIVIGGYDAEKHACSDGINEVSPVLPYTNKLLATMPQKRWYHCVALFGDKIVIVAGVQGMNYGTNLKSVVLYDITKNECQELAPLPYGVSEMATVKWGDDNVILAGGVDSDSKPLNKVLMYNIKTQKSHMLPEMKYKRQGCVAAVVRDTVIVMGGKDERGTFLKSVEGFRFDSYSWQELPELREGRYCATAVVC
ncbi:RING finger 151-like [Paramuricea clavata]|uniref:RING finger 151-like n=1 Tax=Paramuricea clavata TaxID=317549 RepID=A0A6S7H3M6_PARCT|nr:RING finger 151-like [Paramuricea clavata]